MIHTDSAALRAKALVLAAQKADKPLRAFAGIYHGHKGKTIGVRLERSTFVQSLPMRELEVTPTTDVEHLQQMLEDAWIGLRRDHDMKMDRRVSRETPDRRTGWRAGIATECENRKRT